MKLQLLVLLFLLFQSCESMPTVTGFFEPNSTQHSYQSIPTFADISDQNSLEKRIEYLLSSLDQAPLERVYFNNNFEECFINVEKKTMDTLGYSIIFKYLNTQLQQQY